MPCDAMLIMTGRFNGPADDLAASARDKILGENEQGDAH